MEPSECAEQLLGLKTSIERLRLSVNVELDNLSAALDTLARREKDRNNQAHSKPTTEAQLRKKSSPGQDLPEKFFAIRESRIVEIMANEHIRTVFNIFVAFLFLVTVILITSYFYDPQRLNDDMSTIVVNSTGMLGVFGYVLAINLAILFLVHPSLQLWAHCRDLGKSGPVDAIFASLYILFLGCVIAFPVRYIFINELPPLSSCILAFEQVRLLMKVYAYTREIIGRVLAHAQLKAKSENNHVELTMPGLSCVVYFLFAPTLVYRDSYPRTPKVRWANVLWYSGQFLACVALYSVVLNHFIKDLFCDAGKEGFQLLGFTLTGCAIMLLGSISMFLVFYGFLHCWLNIFAEAMRFGDRLFYLDWWNSTTYADYYRSWNLVVHDWLFNYVYRDAYKAFNYNKKRAMLVVFFLSALVHEYILALSYRFFFPVVLVIYGTLGVGLMFATKKKTARFWNVFLWITLIAGWGIILIFYTVEFYSRLNCPTTKSAVADFFIPRSFSWSCNSFSHSSWFSSSFYKQKPSLT
uniref:O-acyltransferase n=1 Tax=Amblyomma sculptum TaxID=1581419 RepID=A0A1E1XQY3_AMBSC